MPLVKALAKAFRWRRLIETGAYTTVAELAAAEKVNASYAGRVVRLTLLAPAVVEAAVAMPGSLSLKDVLRPFSVEWNAQRRALRFAGHLSLRALDQRTQNRQKRHDFLF